MPRAVLSSLFLSALVYILLQLVFIGAVPGKNLIHGWSGVNFSSPCAELAVAVNLTWLSWVLYADAIASPAGSALSFTATTSRESYAMSKNGFLPAAFAVVSGRSGIPRRALVVSFVLGVLFLLPLGSWQQIVAATSVLGLIAYALPSVSAVVFERGGAFPDAPRYVRYVAPVAFVLASLIIYWAGWTELRIALPPLLVGVFVYAYQHRRTGAPWASARLGLWLVVFLVLVLLMSLIGSSDLAARTRSRHRGTRSSSPWSRWRPGWPGYGQAGATWPITRRRSRTTRTRSIFPPWLSSYYDAMYFMLYR